MQLSEILRHLTENTFSCSVSTYYVRKRGILSSTAVVFPIFLFHNKINWNCLGKGEHALIMSCLEVCGNYCKGKKSLCGLQSKKTVNAFLWISACLCLHISAGWDCHCRSNLTDKEKRWLRVSPQNVLISNSIVCIPSAQPVFPAVEMPGSQLQWNRKKSSAR